jgi:beta-mannosidase
MKTTCLDSERYQWFLGGEVDGKAIFIPANVPGSVYLDLQEANLIPDPFVDADKVKWVEEKDWTYSTIFDVDERDLSMEKIILRFDGLDTFTEIYLNGCLVGKTENMFMPYEFNVKELVKPGANVLCVKIVSTSRTLSQLEQTFGKLKSYYRSDRLWGRKASCFSGWSWCPKMLAGGITKPVKLVLLNHSRILDVCTKTETIADKFATVKNEIEIESIRDQLAVLRWSINGENKQVQFGDLPIELKKGNNLIEFRVVVPNPEFWWPNGYGEQNLYRLNLKLESVSGESVEAVERTFGISTVQLIQEPKGDKKSFYFLINGVPIFIKGANWILPDVFLSRISRDKYKELLFLAKEANLNLLRVPGVGIYENDDFYDLCDKFGILIWQDFMFGCGEYPENKEFLGLVGQEIKTVVKGLRNHPSILLWCGGNECEHFRDQNGRLKGDAIYYEIIPKILTNLDGTRPYWQNSPLSEKNINKRFRDVASKWRFDIRAFRYIQHFWDRLTNFIANRQDGDTHIWDVWMWFRDYPAYAKHFAPFITEFGWQALPSHSTFQKFCDKKQVCFFDDTPRLHNSKSRGKYHWYFWTKHFLRPPKDVKELIMASQLLQAEALKFAIENWRRQKFDIGGVIFWQWNDCWPATSYSVVDYYLHEKLAYHAIKKSYAPILLAPVKQKDRVVIWGVNDTLKSITGNLKIVILGQNGEERLFGEFPVAIESNASKILANFPVKDFKKHAGIKIILADSLDTEKVMADNTLFFRKTRDWKIRLNRFLASCLCE